MAKAPPGTCPHCYSDDLDYRATRCPHCGGAFGDSKMRRIIVSLVLLALIIFVIVSASTSTKNAERKACEKVAAINGTSPDDC